ncbi:DNA-binding transcriptional regulator, GntR family [Amycolatopsis arida]|uniref:DNA-binding transcriptional regulator, GntR family n=1 Tax=Amycolatopsis arida TaxID=587909 RepID=A0A1I6A7E1_9PSEU|nr:GntR family transcriptional regulator [Amycolatopsis arida]TDX88555.1 DNA-binding GntR family transcriptional regulator [Amycolatopsis arida]SFQ64553.1 DNA-binding transcriptional regulator, GntR family [Amycolatopsis arida]
MSTPGPTTPVASTPLRRPEPLRSAVYERVVELVSTGELAPGRPVTEAALSRSLGVSRTPVREALLRLEAEGVLESTPARGFTVRPLSPGEAAELYPVLGTLERLAVTSTPPGEVDVAALREVDAALVAARDPVRRWRLDTEFHERIMAACPNRSLRALVSALRVRLSRYEIAYMRVRDEGTSASQHEEIIAALAGRDQERAAAAIERNWSNSLRLVLGWLDQD